MLSNGEIAAGNFIDVPKLSGLRSCSYDLSIGSIISSDGKVRLSHILKRQGIVKVISKERIKLPADVCGVVTIKTSLSDQGVLALNIGLIDPLYDGPISSYLVNFSKDDQPLYNGNAFLRVTFHKISSMPTIQNNVRVESEKYYQDSRSTIVRGFSDTFLNTEKIIDDFVNESMKKYRNQILGYVSGAALVIAVVTFFLNFGNLVVIYRWINPSEVVEANSASRVAAENDLLRRESQELRARVEALENRQKIDRP